jgi:beta-lactam-binding protein with PASTA domain
MSHVPPVDPDDPSFRPVVVPPDAPADVRYVREEHVTTDAFPPVAGDVDINAVHEEERVRVLADGTVLHETDRVEQRSRFRDRLPWILLALLLLAIAVVLVIWYSERSSGKLVPAVVGTQAGAASARLRDDGFAVVQASQSSPRPAGTVLGQRPAAGTRQGSGSTVRLLISKGRGRTTVPNGVGLAQGAARDRLVQAGFRVMTAEVFSDQPRGTVVAQSPPAGGKVGPGTLVRLNISKGSATVDVPSEVGSPVTKAQSDLASKGLTPKFMRVPSTQPIDTVVAQAPTGGQVRRGTTVQLNVSKGAPAAATTTTPTTTVTAPATTTTVATTRTTTTATTSTVTVPTTRTATVTTTTPATTPPPTATTTTP